MDDWKVVTRKKNKKNEKNEKNEKNKKNLGVFLLFSSPAGK